MGRLEQRVVLECARIVPGAVQHPQDQGCKPGLEAGATREEVAGLQAMCAALAQVHQQGRGRPVTCAGARPTLQGQGDDGGTQGTEGQGGELLLSRRGH